MILADKIIQLRKRSGWSQEELAEKMNVSRQSVSKWEGAQSVPDLEKILQLGRIFGVSTDYLLKDEMEEAEYLNESEDVPPVRRVSMQEANEYLQLRQQASKRIAFATVLCILSPICLMLLAAASETGAFGITENLACGIGLIAMLLLVAAAVAIFIATGAKSAHFEYLEKETFETEYGVSGMVREQQKQYRDAYTRGNVLGTCICILSVIPLFAGSFLSTDDLFLVGMFCVMLGLVAVGVFLFISVGVNWAAMQKLLQEGEYSKAHKKRNPSADVIGTVYWLVVVAGYLAWSFHTNDWEKSWIVWPVAGLIYAAVMTLCGAPLKKEK